MAKTKQLPPSRGKSQETAEPKVSTEPQEEAVAESPEMKPTTVAAKAAIETQSSTLTAPMFPEVVGHARRGVDVRGMSIEQRESLQRLTNGLKKDKAKLKNGTLVMNPSASVRWLLEQLV